MKKLYALLALCFSSLLVNSQSSFKILDPDNNETDVTSATLDLWGDPTTDIEKELILKNISSSTKTVKLKRVFVSGFNTTLPNQDTLQICWNVCLAPSWSNTQNAGNVNILADSSANFSTTGIGFHSLFSPCSLLGTRVIRYTFWDSNNYSDSASVVVNYHITGVGIADNKLKNFSFSSPQPNPSAGITFIKYDVPAQTKAHIKIFNVAGTEIKDFALEESNGKISVETGSLPNGIYFYSLILQDKVVGTKKLIVSQ